MKKLLATLLATLSLFAIAGPSPDAPAADCDGLKIATGAKGKGYSLLYTDVAKLCGQKVNLCEVNTAGGLDNLSALSTKEADIGFAQIDTWNDMKTGDENIAALQNVLTVNSNYLHVVTAVAGYVVQGDAKFGGLLKGDMTRIVVNRFSELRGKTVVVVGSAQLLGRRLDKQYGYGMQFIDAKDDLAAFELVKQGKAAAALSLSGWPSGTIKALTQASGLTMVPFDAPVGEPYKVKALNYKGIAVYNNNSLAIQNVLLTRPFSGERAKTIAAVQSCILQNMTELKEGSFQPAWNEVNPSTAIPGISGFKAPKTR